MHDFAVLFNFDSCVTDVSSRLERRGPSRVFSCAFSPSASRPQFRRVRGLPDETRMTRYKSRNSLERTKLISVLGIVYARVLGRTHFYNICITGLFWLRSFFFDPLTFMNIGLIAVQKADDVIMNQFFHRYASPLLLAF